MIKRDQVEAILKINGVQATSPDEQIRSVLLSARYSKDEVDAAIMVLRENTRTKKTRVDGLHKVFRTNDALAPDEISQLLGIEVDVSERVQPISKTRDFSKFQFAMVWVLSFVVSVAGLLFYMYLHQVGVFHPSTSIGVANNGL